MQVFFVLFLSWVLLSCGVSTNNSPELSLEQDAAIVGGKETSKDNVISKYALLIYDTPTKTYCTGLLIKKDIVLTAAHCIDKKTDNLSLAFGIKPMSGDYVMRKSLKVLVHPKYQKGTNNDRNDLALILIQGQAPEGYQVVSLPDETFPLQEGLGFTAAGYGRITGKKEQGNDPQGSGFLRHVELKIDSFSPDKSQFYVNQKSGKGICNGDSGGPALMRYNGKDYVVGIASAIYWTVPDELSGDKKQQYIENKDVCSEKSIYMSVQHFRPWIEEKSRQLATDSAKPLAQKSRIIK